MNTPQEFNDQGAVSVDLVINTLDYAGMMSVFRNPYAHQIQDPSPEVGGAIIVFIDLLLKMLDDFEKKGN